MASTDRLSPARLMAWLPALALLGACGGAPEREFLLLAEGYEPRPHGAGEVLLDDGSGRRYIADRGDGLWIERDIRAEDWFPGPLPGTFAVRRAIGQVGIPTDSTAPTRLWLGGAESEWIDPDRGALEQDLLQAGRFSALGDSVVAFTGASGEAPGAGKLATYVSLGFEDEGTWTARLIGMSGAGFLLLPRLEERLTLLDERAGRLRFGVAAQSFSVRSGVESSSGMDVSLDGKLLAQFDLTATATPEVQRLEVELPPGRGKRRLEFRSRCDDALCAVFEPRIEFEGHSPGARQDVVVFLADTFRADNLSAYRGSPAGVEVQLTPVLDAFAESSTLYRNAWAPSSWTLPSHASLFASLWPTEHGAGWAGFQLSTEAVTLAEQLRANDYRTFAVTDGGFCSETLGLAQGFDLWLEGERDLARTRTEFERFAAEDDGRPRFVFLQTYRTHEPFVAGPRVRAELASQGFEVGPEHEISSAALGEAFGIWKSGGERAEDRARFERAAAELASLYRAGSRELDLEFGAWLERFDALGLGDEQDLLVFTSDHGEALLEHEFFGHWDGVWEEQTRVPLLVRRPGGFTGAVEAPACLVDLAPTLMDWLGLEAPDAWSGRALDLEPGSTRDLHFIARRLPLGPTARLAGSMKLVRLPEQERALLFDLSRDPAEREGLELPIEAKELRSALLDHGEPASLADPLPELRFDLAGQQALDRRQIERLRQLGYSEAFEQGKTPPE